MANPKKPSQLRGNRKGAAFLAIGIEIASLVMLSIAIDNQPRLLTGCPWQLGCPSNDSQSPELKPLSLFCISEGPVKEFYHSSMHIIYC